MDDTVVRNRASKRGYEGRERREVAAGKSRDDLCTCEGMVGAYGAAVERLKHMRAGNAPTG